MSNDVSAQATTDPVQVLWSAYRQCVSVWEAAGTPMEGDAMDAMALAEEHFIEAPTTSLLGIRLKLEHVAETDNMAGALVRNPSLTVNRIVLGLLGDLKSEPRRP